MTVVYHTDIAAGADVNALTVNNPLGQLDDAIVKGLNGQNIVTGIKWAVTSLTIAAGTVALPSVSTGVIIELTSESGTTDQLDTITNGAVGQVIVVRAASGHGITISSGLSSNRLSIPNSYNIFVNNLSALMFRFSGSFWQCLNMDPGANRVIDWTAWNSAFNQAVQPNPYSTLITPPNAIRPNPTAPALGDLMVEPSRAVRNQFYIRCAMGATTIDSGPSPTATAGVAANKVIDTFNNYASGAAAGNFGGIISATMNATRVGMKPILSCRFNTGADITNVRYWIGLLSVAPTNSDVPPTNYSGLTYSGGVDTEFKLQNSNAGVLQTPQVLGNAVAVNTTYDLEIYYMLINASTFTRAYLWSVNDTTGVRTLEGFASIAETVATSVDLGYIAEVQTKVAVAKTWQISRVAINYGL